ncbi:MAG TPA: type II secretion system F family protein [Solimonas sp.]|nr:type II secretion system F family protein [Solimonas sp.]
MSPGLFAGLVAAAIVLGVFALLAVSALILRTRGESRLQRRLTPMVSADGEFEDDGERPWLTTIARGGKRIEGWVDTEGETGKLLVQAGWRSSQARLMWYAFQAVVPVLMGLLVVAYWMLGPDKNKALLTLLYALGAGALGFLVPRWVLRSAARKRQRRIKQEVPLFLHLLVLLFEAGLSTRQAFASLVREGSGVLPQLGREFELLLRSLEAGADTAELLKSLADTLDVEDLTSVLGVLRQVDRYGGEVREPLLEALEVLEQRRSMDLREKVNLMSGRMTVVMVLFFFPALLIFVAGPAFLSILRALADVTSR